MELKILLPATSPRSTIKSCFIKSFFIRFSYIKQVNTLGLDIVFDFFSAMVEAHRAFEFASAAKLNGQRLCVIKYEY
jgi:hypothetical protein